MSNRTFALDDPGNAFRRTDGAPVKIGGLYKEEADSGQITFTDGQGNKYWFVDTTPGPVTVPLPSAQDTTPDVIYTVKITAGANSCTVTPDSGNIDGAASFAFSTLYASYSFVSDGTNYWII